MGRRDDLHRLEEEGWRELSDAVVALSPEQRELPGVTPEGWSAKDLLWHIRCWLEELAGVLAEMREGTFLQEAHEVDTDARNAAFFAQSRAMDLAEVTAAVDDARRRVQDSWDALPEVDEEAETWFSEESIDHYEEHLADLRRFVTQLSTRR